ncbi:MAG TPA: hypothetical protein VL996_09770 [Methylocella sp.]|nr:hypothetical protein [Methylocella sp.]
MKIKLRVTKADAVLYEGVHDIQDAEGFGAACAEVWEHLRAQRLEKATSIGALYDVLNDDVLDLLQGAKINLDKAR